MKCPSHVTPHAHSMNLVTWERKQAGQRVGGMAAGPVKPRPDSGEASPLPLQVNGRGGKGEGLEV